MLLPLPLPLLWHQLLVHRKAGQASELLLLLLGLALHLSLVLAVLPSETPLPPLFKFRRREVYSLHLKGGVLPPRSS